jgi:hypothetical protein
MAWWEADGEEALQQIEGEMTLGGTADESLVVIDLSVRLLLLDMAEILVHRFTCMQFWLMKPNKYIRSAPDDFFQDRSAESVLSCSRETGYDQLI